MRKLIFSILLAAAAVFLFLVPCALAEESGFLNSVRVPPEGIGNGVVVEEVTSQDVQFDNIRLSRDANNNLDYIQYQIASTYSQAGIRYRTTAITVSIPGLDEEIVIPTEEIFEEFRELFTAKPDFRWGRTYYSMMTIYRDAIINNSSNPARTAELLDKALYIDVGAHIEIYRVETGEVLATLTSKDDVMSNVLEQLQMQHHRNKMLTRFKRLRLKYPDFWLIIDPGIEKESQIDSNTWWAEPGKTYNGKLYVYVQKEQGTSSSVELENDYDFPVALKMLGSFIELKGDKFTPDEQVLGVYRLSKVGEGEYTADFTYTMPKNRRAVKIWGAVNTTEYGIIPDKDEMKFEPREANLENNAASVNLRANLPDLSIKAPHRKYVGPRGGSVDIAPIITNDSRSKLAFNTTLSWRWKDEPGQWHVSRIDLPYTGEQGATFSMPVPVPDQERRLIIAVNKEIAEDPPNASPMYELDWDNNFDGASLKESIQPKQPPEDYFPSGAEPQEIIVAPEEICRDFVLWIEPKNRSSSYWEGQQVELRIYVKPPPGNMVGFCDEFGNCRPVPYNVEVGWMNGRHFSKIDTLSLMDGNPDYVSEVVTLSAGRNVFTATTGKIYAVTQLLEGIDPFEEDIPDCIPGNNTDTYVINAKKRPTPPGESGMHVELIR